MPKKPPGEEARPPRPVAALPRFRRRDVDVIQTGDDLDLYTLAALREATDDEDLLARGRLVIDMTGTTFVDPAALAVLVSTLRRIRARNAGGVIGVAWGHDKVYQAISAVGLGTVLLVRYGMDAAIDAVRSAALPEAELA